MNIAKQVKRKTRRYCNCAHLTFWKTKKTLRLALFDSRCQRLSFMIQSLLSISLVAVVVFVIAIVIMARKRQALDNISRVSFSKTKCFKDLAEDLWRMNVQKRRQLFNGLLLFTENSTIRLVVQHLLRQFVKQNCKLKTGRSACGAEVSASCLW